MNTARAARSLLGLAAALSLVGLLPGIATAASVTIVSTSPVLFAFTPAAVTIPAGSAVTWTNRSPAGSEPHTVTADDFSFESDLLYDGQTFSRTFGQPGRFAYHCEIHPDMTGIVIVTGTPARTPPATPGPTATPHPTATPPATPAATGPPPASAPLTAPPAATPAPAGSSPQPAAASPTPRSSTAPVATPPPTLRPATPVPASAPTAPPTTEPAVRATGASAGAGRTSAAAGGASSATGGSGSGAPSPIPMSTLLPDVSGPGTPRGPTPDAVQVVAAAAGIVVLGGAGLAVALRSRRRAAP